MRLHYLISIISTLATLERDVLAGQVPVVGNVLGGVPRPGNLDIEKTLAVPQSNGTTRTPGKLRLVENSGVCETTQGVYQASGYADISDSKSIWFWFFASRKNPDTAPLTLWFNGGPGSSSMIGLFQEHGPCRITNDSSSVTLNPYSWNNESNMLYIDQPVGVGFSYGLENVTTSQEAAADIWTFMQTFLSDQRFSKYQKNKLAIWTESYGGHYGPAFATYFLSQNIAINSGSTQGLKLNLQVLGIGNGLTDPLTQYAEYTTYAASNPYYPLVSQSVIDAANSTWMQPNGCRDQITNCNNGGSNVNCSMAQDFCNTQILGPLYGNFDVYYVLSTNPDRYPPDISNYLASIATKVGATDSDWEETNNDIYDGFASTGDWMRTFKPDLESVINAGVRTIIYDGDADYILNFIGMEAMVDSLETNFTSTYQQQQFKTFKVANQTAGQYKNAGTFSYLRVYGSGHEVPAYKFGSLATGQAAAQMFTQIMANQSLASDPPGSDEPASSDVTGNGSVKHSSAQAIYCYSKYPIVLAILVMTLPLM